MYCALPLNAMSRIWGKLCHLELPVWLRPSIYKLYVKIFDCNMSEALDPDYRHYTSVSHFFRRRLKPECRPVAQNPLVY